MIATRALSRRLLSATWSRLKGLEAGLPVDSVHPGVADDRFQAALSTRLFAAGLAPGRRVLDLSPVLGTGSVLLASGPRRLDLVEPDRRRRAWIQRHEPAAMELLGEPPAATAEGDYDLVVASAGADLAPRHDARSRTATSVPMLCAERLASRGVLVLWRTDPSAPRTGLAGVSEPIEGALAHSFVTVERLWHLTPPGYRVAWNDRLPARARAHEYRVVTDSGSPPADDELLDALWIARNPRRHLPGGPLRLHVGSGDQRLEGWVNLDRLPFPAVDVVLDVAAGLPFEGCEAVYAEHFLEHLEVDAALRFLQAAHAALDADGILRLSTPSLDWTWRTQYAPCDSRGDQRETDLALEQAIQLNRAFYGWKHRFLWNRGTLELALAAAGFVELEWPARGESRHSFLRGVERHETSPDDPACPHVLIVEAKKGASQPARLERLLDRLRRDFLTPVAYLG
ncbi:MAG TPA: hypothetical protein VMT85_03440 [Thermoanaerobaculia bacterium]|nr:hypothetical protein [Thermoanaerobaculia bacterium]